MGILDEAAALVEGERADAYGDCVALHRRIAQLFNAYMDGKAEASAYDAAVFLILVKIARMRHKPSADSHTDIAGYASICHSIFERGFHTDKYGSVEEENGGS